MLEPTKQIRKPTIKESLKKIHYLFLLFFLNLKNIVIIYLFYIVAVLDIRASSI